MISSQRATTSGNQGRGFSSASCWGAVGELPTRAPHDWQKGSSSASSGAPQLGQAAGAAGPGFGGAGAAPSGPMIVPSSSGFWLIATSHPDAGVSDLDLGLGAGERRQVQAVDLQQRDLAAVRIVLD